MLIKLLIKCFIIKRNEVIWNILSYYLLPYSFVREYNISNSNWVTRRKKFHLSSLKLRKWNQFSEYIEIWLKLKENLNFKWKLYSPRNIFQLPLRHLKKCPKSPKRRWKMVKSREKSCAGFCLTGSLAQLHNLSIRAVPGQKPRLAIFSFARARNVRANGHRQYERHAKAAAKILLSVFPSKSRLSPLRAARIALQ